MTYVNTRYIKIIITRLFCILLRFHAVSSHLLLNFYHSNDPEPKVHFFVHAPRGINAKNQYEENPAKMAAKIDFCRG